MKSNLRSAGSSDVPQLERYDENVSGMSNLTERCERAAPSTRGRASRVLRRCCPRMAESPGVGGGEPDVIDTSEEGIVSSGVVLGAGGADGLTRRLEPTPHLLAFRLVPRPAPRLTRGVRAGTTRGGGRRMAQIRVVVSSASLILALGVGSVNAQTFLDDFNRPDSMTVGNGWLDSPSNVGGNLSIQAGQLTTIGNSAGIYRPFPFDRPVTVAATIAETSGYGGLPRAYRALVGIRSDGTPSSGYRLEFSRSDINYNNSVIRLLDGDTEVAQIAPNIQFGASIDLSITLGTNGCIIGTVTQNGQSERFSFPPHAIQSMGDNALVALGGPDNRGTTSPIYHRLDNFRLDYDTGEPCASPKLTFPLKGVSPGIDEGLTPETAVINSYFDHSMKNRAGEYQLYKCDKQVEAYTNEVGNAHPSGLHPRTSAQYFAIQCRQGYAQDDSHTPFGVNEHYAGGGDNTHLYYDGHPGIDYRAALGTEVYAAVTGTVHYPQDSVGLPSARNYHALEIVPDQPGYGVYYLHLLLYPSTGVCSNNRAVSCTADQRCGPGNICRLRRPGEGVCSDEPRTACDTRNAATRCGASNTCEISRSITDNGTDIDGYPCPSPVTLPLPEGEAVKAGCLVALSGQAGPKGTPPHLHFEVQRILPFSSVSPSLTTSTSIRNRIRCPDDSTRACIPVDPYGPLASDPYEALTGIATLRLWR